MSLFNKKIKITLVICLLLLCFHKGFSEDKSYYWDFSNCNIKDIIFAVSVDTGISIVPDDTVTGFGDFQFSGGDFKEAFNTFLRRSRLYVEEKDNVLTVSKFKFEKKGEKYYLDAYDLYPIQIIEKLSEEADWVITYDSLPNYKISVHFKDLSESELMFSLSKCLGEWILVENTNGYHFEKEKNLPNYNYSDSNIEISTNENENYLVNIKNGKFNEIIEKLFEKGRENGDKYDYCILSNIDNIVSRSFFHGENFFNTLNTICLQSGFKTEKANNIIYILSYSNSISEIIDGEKNWFKFSLQYISSNSFVTLLKKKLGNLEVIELFDNYSFLCNCSLNQKKLIEELIKLGDVKETVKLITLKYMKPEEILNFLPPDINKNCLFLADNNSQLYFKGTEESFKNIVEQIKVIDKPVQRISYDLLILQSDENNENNWSSSISAKQMKMGERSNVTAMLGSVMGFNLNVVGVFGLNFAARLQSSIEENKTRVYADTTLHGVSGKKITFQNTNTYRYRDNNVNPETGKPIYSGVTKEIITGIKVDVLGWVSGEGTITSTVTASISRQGIDNSASTGNPPPTSEKLITTEVTCKSGEPVVLSGLLLSAESESAKRSPLISKIPLIGNLFKNKNKTNENSQMIIYLVPHLISNEENINQTNNTEEEINNQIWVENQITSILEKIKEECKNGKEL